MRRALLLVSALVAVGCLPPPVPAQTLADSAYDLNVAARFGRMDIALEGVSMDARKDFVLRHASWGQSLRVVDVEMLEMNMASRSEADVVVDVSWQRMDESTLRKTRILQRFVDERGTWRLVSEKRTGGDEGLIELPKKKGSRDAEEEESAPPRRDARFRTRVIASE